MSIEFRGGGGSCTENFVKIAFLERRGSVSRITHGYTDHEYAFIIFKKKIWAFDLLLIFKDISNTGIKNHLKRHIENNI